MHMRLTDLGRRFGNWLGIEPDDPDAVLKDMHRDLSRDGAGFGAGVARERTPHGSTQIRSRLLATRAISSSPNYDRAIAELRRLIDLRSDLDPHHEG